MQIYYIASSAQWPGVSIWEGNNYYARVRWAIDEALLADPPGIPRTPQNYSETAPVHVVVGPPKEAPLSLRVDVSWWQSIRDMNRNLFAVLEYRYTTTDAWSFWENFIFVINHDPVANAGPDQVIQLDAAGQILNDVFLDGTLTDDQDLHVAINPDLGPLNYRWSQAGEPPTFNWNGTVWTQASSLDNIANPLFLAAGTLIPIGDRGTYTFRLTVHDNDIATLGNARGKTGTHTADTHILINSGEPNLFLESPTENSRYYGNQIDGIYVPIWYSIGNTIANDPAYAGRWMIRCRITQRVATPENIAPSAPIGTVVYESTKVSYQQTDYFLWDGWYSGGQVHGAFDIELELLDRDGNSTGVAGSVVNAAEAIVIDGYRWYLPVRASQNQAVLSGGFMESGHAGRHNTHLHTGIDIISSATPRPDLVAARSGIYSRSNVHFIRVTHAAPDITEYLHGDNFAAYGLNNGDLVLQGQSLARMSNSGVPGIHLHFEYRTSPPEVIHNPLAIINLPDMFLPHIDAVFIREAAAAGTPADLTNPSSGIAGIADLIVRCRDRAHISRTDVDTRIHNGPFSIRVEEENAVADWPWIRFWSMTRANHLSEFFAEQGRRGVAMNEFNHYLPYLRWDTAAYNRDTGPVTLYVNVGDFYETDLLVDTRRIMIGPELDLITAPTDPAIDVADPQPFTIEIRVTCRIEGLNDNQVNNTSFKTSDNYHIALSGAPANWTVVPNQTGLMNNGDVSNMVITIDPDANVVAGTYNFQVVVYSDVLQQIGQKIPISARIG